MNKPRYIDPVERAAIIHALEVGDAHQAFTRLADYLARNRMTLSDEVFRLYLERELFSCLKGRGHIFDTI